MRNGAVDVLPAQQVGHIAWSPEGQVMALTTVC